MNIREQGACLLVLFAYAEVKQFWEVKMEIRLCEEHEIEAVGEFYDKVVYHLCNTIN